MYTLYSGLIRYCEYLTDALIEYTGSAVSTIAVSAAVSVAFCTWILYVKPGPTLTLIVGPVGITCLYRILFFNFF